METVSNQKLDASQPPSREVSSDRASHTHFVDEHLEKILIWAQARYGNDELVQAKEEFFWKTGKVFYDDNFYENRMGYFIDYFLLERPLASAEHISDVATPFNSYLAQAISDRENNPNAVLFKHRHSVFQIQKVSDQKLTVIDLIDRDRVNVNARPFESYRALQRKDIFQGFLYFAKDSVFLSQGLIFHPAKVARVLRKKLKKALIHDGFDRPRELSRLAKLHLKHLRHAHVDPKRIYGELDQQT